MLLKPGWMKHNTGDLNFAVLSGWNSSHYVWAISINLDNFKKILDINVIGKKYAIILCCNNEILYVCMYVCMQGIEVMVFQLKE